VGRWEEVVSDLLLMGWDGLVVVRVSLLLYTAERTAVMRGLAGAQVVSRHLWEGE
jgi:hypothetical protein